MELLANTFAASLLVLLLASTATGATPSAGAAPAAPRQRAGVVGTTQDKVSREEEAAAGPLAEEEEADAAAAPSWYRMLPHGGQGEQANERALTPQNLKESLNAVSTRLLQRLRTAGGNEQAVKMPNFLQRVILDPELQATLGKLVLGAAGMTATGLLMGDFRTAVLIALSALYAMSFASVLKNGANVAGKFAAGIVEQEKVRRAEQVLREQLERLLFGPRGDAELAQDGLEDQ